MPPLVTVLRLGVIGVGLAASLGGCRDFGDVTASIAGFAVVAAARPTEIGLRAYADHWGKVYADKPGEKFASINYSRALRAETRYKEAVAVMQAAAVKAPKDYEVLGEFGKALADNGELNQARDVLSRSYPEDRPNWTLLSAQGSVADRLDDHASAQSYLPRRAEDRARPAVGAQQSRAVLRAGQATRPGRGDAETRRGAAEGGCACAAEFGAGAGAGRQVRRG